MYTNYINRLDVSNVRYMIAPYDWHTNSFSGITYDICTEYFTDNSRLDISSSKSYDGTWEKAITNTPYKKYNLVKDEPFTSPYKHVFTVSYDNHYHHVWADISTNDISNAPIFVLSLSNEDVTWYRDKDICGIKNDLSNILPLPRYWSMGRDIKLYNEDNKIYNN